MTITNGIPWKIAVILLSHHEWDNLQIVISADETISSPEITVDIDMLTTVWKLFRLTVVYTEWTGS